MAILEEQALTPVIPGVVIRSGVPTTVEVLEVDEDLPALVRIYHGDDFLEGSAEAVQLWLHHTHRKLLGALAAAEREAESADEAPNLHDTWAEHWGER